MKRDQFSYPLARKSDVVDDFFGRQIADPYRWLEDPDSAETKAFVAAQSELTNDFLSEIPGREQIRARLSELYNYSRYNGLNKKADVYFVWKNDGLQDQPVMVRRQTLSSQNETMLDPNTLSEDGTVAVTNTFLDKTATRLAYTVTDGGSDWQEIHIRDLTSGKAFPEKIRHVRFSSIAWHPSGNGFFYNGFVDPATVPADRANYNNRLMWHTLGTPQSQDQIVYQRPDAPELNFGPMLTEDGDYLWCTPWHGAIALNRLYVSRVDPKNPAVLPEQDFIRIVDEPDAYYWPIGNDGNIFYVLTDLDAPNKRIVAIDVDNPDRANWREIVAEGADAIAFARIINGKIVLVTLHNAYHRLFLANMDGTIAREIELPALGTIFSLNGNRDDKEFTIDFASFLYPTTILRYEFESQTLSTFESPQLDFDPSQYETVQIFATSRDGTKVPCFVTHKKGLQLDGSHPTILYGYGGYSINLTPMFSVARLHWLEMGGVFAQAVLRGGAEFGDEWHKAGMLDQKQNVFDDFIACSEQLIRDRFTQSSKLAIQGGSNGGLLVAACMVQRPDLFGAVLCHVPVLDMLRYQKFTAGRYWIPEYGDPSIEEQFDFMVAYSPLHNIESGETYPPMLILTADKDDRVVPMHAHKFAATIQDVDTGKNPLLLRFELRAGHGFGKSTTKIINEYTDIFAFLWQMLEMPA